MPRSSRTNYVMDMLEPRLLLSGRVVGYFPEYRWGTFDNIDMSALTHLNYFSVTANTNGTLSTSNINLSHMAQIRNKAHSFNVGVSITVGPQSFATIAGSTTATNAFVNNIVNFATTHNLDGIDMDWEPTPTGSNIALYGNLIDALYAQTAPLGLKLTAAVNPLNKEIPLAATAKLDWLNVMCYDFSPSNHSTYTASVNAMNGWANYGVPKSKLVMGVPFYGRQGSTWQNTTARTYGAVMNDHFGTNGVYPSPDADLVDGWYFNGKSTIANKSNFVVNNGFGGIMIWELGQDHFIGGQYTDMSLLPVIKQIIQPGDNIPPTIEQASFLFETAPHRVSFQFSENVSASLQTSDLVVRDVVTQASIIVTGVSYDTTTNTATFTLNNVIPDGTYRATLSGSGVHDPAGNPLGEDYLFDFFFLGGDANGDGIVNLADFNILATNFGQSNRTFAEGDFNYDGQVNLSDFNILAAQFGTSLGSAATLGSPDVTSGTSDAGGTSHPTLTGRANGASRSPAPAPAPAPSARSGRGEPLFSDTRIPRSGPLDPQSADDVLALV